METTRLLIVVKTYPHPSKSYQELVCTAGMRQDGSFVRLYPVDFRYQPLYKWYQKYQWIEVDIEKNTKDFRPESYRPNLDTIRIVSEPLSAKRHWEERKRIVLAQPPQSMCDLRANYPATHTSLGIIKPKSVLDLTVAPDSEEWDEKHSEALAQYSLFDQNKKPLKKIPFKFSYRFLCEADQCPGHEMSITDWELGVLYINECERLGSREQAVKNVRAKFFEQICAPDKDTHFFVGTIFPHNSWIVLGTFWPEKTNKPLQENLDL